MADVERIGGWGSGFNRVSAALLVAITAYPLTALFFGTPGNRSALVLVGGGIGWLGLACFVLLLIRMNHCGVRIETGEVIVINPRGTARIPVTEVEGFGKSTFGNEALLLKDGRRITLWGIEWWVGWNNALIREGKKELAWRLERERESSHNESPPASARTSPSGSRPDALSASARRA